MDIFNNLWNLYLSLVFSLSLQGSASYCNVTSPVVVNIFQGTLQGVSKTSLYGRTFCAFKGIPYSQPPLGECRFKAPRQPLQWSGTLNATTEPPPCLQFNSELETIGKEDCLYLSVYTPQLATQNDDPFPVMVYIPGEDWVSSATTNYGPEYLMDRDVVLVIINYRLGSLGFLSTGDGTAPGNFGLKDQVQALRWVRDNINAFGGDPNKVTIFGHSSGAASVHYHILSPMSTGLFHRAIMQSGTAVSPDFRPSTDAAAWTRRLARLVGCSTENTTQLIACMRVADAKKLLKLGASYHTPVVEDDAEEEVFLPDHPFHLMKDGRVNGVPVLLGTVGNEGSYWAAKTLQNPEEIQKWNDHVDDFTDAPSSFQLFNEKHCGRDLWEPILNYYFGASNHTFDISKSEALSKMYGDRKVYYPVHVATTMLSISGLQPIFVYNFDYSSSDHMYNFSTEFGPYIGVSHGDDKLYFFNYTHPPRSDVTSLEDMAISTFTTLWASFAKEGNPTPHVQIHDVVWEPVQPFTQTNFHIQYLQITRAVPSSGKLVDLRIREDLFKERMDFWKALPLEDNPYLSVTAKMSSSYGPALRSTVIAIVLSAVVVLFC
ncbi:juvenile hormone esterase-like [Periplaneta americana]|uniref:juvenile hormone esterase-like n=1 Tax=Periplaneta americana TaxID=6978 RepID=UPI0037E7D4AF